MLYMYINNIVQNLKILFEFLFTLFVQFLLTGLLGIL